MFVHAYLDSWADNVGWLVGAADRHSFKVGRGSQHSRFLWIDDFQLMHFSFVAPEKAQYSIVCTVSGMVRDFRELQP